MCIELPSHEDDVSGCLNRYTLSDVGCTAGWNMTTADSGKKAEWRDNGLPLQGGYE